MEPAPGPIDNKPGAFPRRLGNLDEDGNDYVGNKYKWIETPYNTPREADYMYVLNG